MRVAHLSDTHLGFAQFERTDATTGLNVREQDGYRAFEYGCGRIRELQPDLVIHSGDLFDRPRPPNSAIIVALRQFAQLARAGIPVIVISGNHCIPTMRGTAPILEALEVVEGVHAVFSKPRSLIVGKARVVAIPHLGRETDLCKAVEEARPDPAFSRNILVVHAGLRGGPSREWTEALVPRLLIKEKAATFDYVALGHYHRALKIAAMAWYAGATERFLDVSPRGKKGFLLADLEKRQVDHHPIPTRPFVRLDPIKCAGLSPPEIVAKILRAATGVPSGAVLFITLAGLSQAAHVGLNSAEIRGKLARMLHVEIRMGRKRGPKQVVEPLSAEPLPVQFEEFVESRIPDPEFRRTVVGMARGYFDRTRDAGAG
jgi:hypothetical protein